MRRGLKAFAVVTMCILVAGCQHGYLNHRKVAPTAPTTTTRPVGPPLAESALKNLLLTPEQINPIMGATDMSVAQKRIGLSDDSGTMEPRECLAVDGAAQAKVYAPSGFTAVREQTLSEGNNFAHYVAQAVVLFPSARLAGAFFDSSAKQWPACRHYSHPQSGSQWYVEAVSNIDDMLSTVAIQENADSSGWACGRALTARNNVVVDVNTCSADPKDSAINIAHEIADRVSAGQRTG